MLAYIYIYSVVNTHDVFLLVFQKPDDCKVMTRHYRDVKPYPTSMVINAYHQHNPADGELTPNLSHRVPLSEHP